MYIVQKDNVFTLFQILKSTNRPIPLVDPSEITPTEILDLKTIVRGEHRLMPVSSIVPRPLPSHIPQPQTIQNGVILPKTSNVARSNSLRSSSPPNIRRDLRNKAKVPPSVPEESPPVPPAPQQFPSLRRDHSNYALNKPIPESPIDWNQHGHDPSTRTMDVNDNQQGTLTYQNIQNANVPYQHNHPPQTMPHGALQSHNGNNHNMGKLSLLILFLI